MHAIEIVRVDPRTDRGSAEAILALQKRSYAVEADLIGDDRIPLLHETVEDLRDARVDWIAARDGRNMVGALAFSADEIDRLVVSPDVHRRGIGSALVAAALTKMSVGHVNVATGRDNPPARKLYEKFGFCHVRDDEVLPGLWLARYQLVR